MLSTDNANEMQILYNTTSEVAGFQYIINWCSNNWVDTNQDGTPDTVLDYVCPDGFESGSLDELSWNQVATDNWTISFDHQPTYTHVIGLWLNIPSETAQGTISPGCGALATVSYTGNIHSVIEVNWSGPVVDGDAQDLGSVSYTHLRDHETKANRGSRGQH